MITFANSPIRGKLNQVMKSMPYKLELLKNMNSINSTIFCSYGVDFSDIKNAYGFNMPISFEIDRKNTLPVQQIKLHSVI